MNSKNNYIGCIGILLLIVCFLCLFLNKILCNKPLPPLEKHPDVVRKEAITYLHKNQHSLMKVIDILKSYNFNMPILYANHGRMGHNIWQIYPDGHKAELADNHKELFNYLVKMLVTGGELNPCEIYSDSVITRFYRPGHGIVDRWLINSICYSECSFDELRQYRYNTKVYSKEEIPDTRGAYFWEIEKNWYIFEHKFYFDQDTISGIKNSIEWAKNNKELFFTRMSDTLDIIVNEFQRLSLANNSYISEFDGLWQIRNDGKSYFLYPKTKVLDSLFSNVHYNLFSFDYNSKFIRVNLWSNRLLKYYYSEMAQDSLEYLINRKVFKLKDNWYYEDF